MKRLIFTLSLVTLLASCGSATKEVKVYEPTWESLSAHNLNPEWFMDSKLGIYFHWAPYVVPAYGNAWYPRFMYNNHGQLEAWGSNIYPHHIETYGADFDYHDFFPMFTAEHFDAKEWAELFDDAGAKFAGPVAVHHDGYALWSSDVNPFSVGSSGPHKDILGELFTELEKRDMHTIATFHHARTGQRYAADTANWGGENSHYPYDPELVTSTTDPKLKYLYGNLPEDEFNDYWLAQVEEVVEKYTPDIIWFDSWLDEIPESHRQRMMASQFNSGERANKETMVVCKQEDLPLDIAVLDVEQGGLKEMGENYWLTDITISTGTWSYTKGQQYKSVDVLVRNMVDVWSKKGVVLLNISPRADGVINDEQRAVLHELGAWMKENGEAIYGSRAYSMFGYGDAEIEEGEFGGQSATMEYSASDVRFTQSQDGKTIYAFILGMPKANCELTLHHIVGDVKNVKTVGSNTELKWSKDGENLTISTPAASAMNEIATVFAISIK